MTTGRDNITIIRAKKAFREAGKVKRPAAKSSLRPFSMSLSEEERAFLDEHCGGWPWASYIRECIFGQKTTMRRTVRRPRIADKELAEVLSGLGQSRFASNVNQLTKSANMGALDVSVDTERRLEEACKAILAMRDALIMALNLKL